MRVLKSADPRWVFHAMGESARQRLLLLKGGKGAYLHIRIGRPGCDCPSCQPVYAIFSGPKSLRKLAMAILEEIPE